MKAILNVANRDDGMPSLLVEKAEDTRIEVKPCLIKVGQVTEVTALVEGLPEFSTEAHLIDIDFSMGVVTATFGRRFVGGLLRQLSASILPSIPAFGVLSLLSRNTDEHT
ncbi:MULTISPECIES: hypothetical protein [unclassified Streptomyces]|uniref:hypothetical protein n=1 Tax=unclassified Streptomyces TaxID=2593676 RepID=UPI0035DF37CD